MSAVQWTLIKRRLDVRKSGLYAYDTLNDVLALVCCLVQLSSLLAFIMVFGRLVHYAMDAVLLSTVVAGVRRSTGFEWVAASRVPRNNSPTIHRPQTALISEPTIRSMVEKFMGVGETVFDVVQASAVNSSYWKRSSR
jgi:hypothetical protein